MKKTRDRVKELIRVKASELRASASNWRLHGDQQKAAMRGILDEVGFVSGLIAFRDKRGKLTLIDGHLRKEISGDELVPVQVVDLTEAEAKKILATFDPIGAMATSNAEALESLLAGVKTDSEGVAAMLAELMAQANAAKPVPLVHEDEVPKPPKVAITKTGDLYQLGEHRLLCGDSTKAEDVERLFAGGRASLLFTSPPYGQQRDYGAAKEKVQDWDGLMNGVFQHAKTVMEPDGQLLVNLGLIHRDGEWVPYWDGWIAWMREQGWRRFGWYVWDQGPGLPGDWNGRCAPSHEFIFHFNAASVRPQKTAECKHAGVANHGTGLRGKNGQVNGYSHMGRDVQLRKVPDSVFRVCRHKARGIECKHPAVFPVLLASEALKAWPGLAYEPFAGSGTTMIAAEQLNRRCYGIELDPAYCDVAVARWERLTGKKAKRIPTKGTGSNGRKQ
jgi:DNA modification methylase